jgi:uncharacterized protein
MPLLMCPNCQASMQAVTRTGVEFDMCPTCRGVWLDRGELEKLVAMGRDDAYAHAAPAERDMQPGYQERPRWDDDDDERHGRPRRRRGFSIMDIFD